MKVNKILVTRANPEQSPRFLYVVCNEIKPLWDEAAFPKFIMFLKLILANCVDSMLFHRFYDSYNFVSRDFQNTLKEFVQTLP